MEEKDGHHARGVTGSIRPTVLQDSESSCIPANTRETRAPGGADTVSPLRWVHRGGCCRWGEDVST